MITDLTPFCLAPHHTLRDAMRCIDANTKGIALVIDAAARLLYTITDGDLRRAVLHGLSLDSTIVEWAHVRPEFGNVQPKTVLAGTPAAVIRDRMQPEGLRHMPIVDEHRVLVGLVLADDGLAPADLPLHAVVMAGGRGSRLAPLTSELPKSMLPVGDRPLMEHIVEQLRQSGVHRVSVTTHYHAQRIVEHFGDGGRFGVEIDYVNETAPLGTAGGLGLLPPWESPLLVVNGDILTRVNFQSMLAYHSESGGIMTVGVRQYRLPMAYGIVETDGIEVRGIREKPTLQFFANAGVYLLEPAVRGHIVPDRVLDMPDLIKALIADGRRVVSFPISEYWLDVGQHEDYRRAQVDVTNGTC